MKKKYINKLFYNLSGFICFLMLCPALVYAVLSSIIDNYSNSILMIIAIVFFTIVILGIILTYLLNIRISRKRLFIYNNIIKKDKKYDEGLVQLENLMRFPQARINVGNTLLYIAYTKLFKEEYSEASEMFEEIKEFNIKFNLGIKNIALSSYYKILIHLLLDNKDSREKEIEYFKSIHLKLNNQIFNDLIYNVNAIENNDIDDLINSLSKQSNSFVDKVILKLKKSDII